MYYSAQTDQYFKEGEPFTLNNNQYPNNWAEIYSPLEKTNLGLVEVTIIGAREDDRYYWVNESLSNGVLTITNQPKNPEILLANEIAQLKNEIDQLETSKLMPRATREFMLLFMESSFTPEQLAQNQGYVSVKEFDNIIKDKRTLLNNKLGQL